MINQEFEVIAIFLLKEFCALEKDRRVKMKENSGSRCYKTTFIINIIDKLPNNIKDDFNYEAIKRQLHTYAGRNEDRKQLKHFRRLCEMERERERERV